MDNFKSALLDEIRENIVAVYEHMSHVAGWTFEEDSADFIAEVAIEMVVSYSFNLHTLGINDVDLALKDALKNIAERSERE